MGIIFFIQRFSSVIILSNLSVVLYFTDAVGRGDAPKNHTIVTFCNTVGVGARCHQKDPSNYPG